MPRASATAPRASSAPLDVKAWLSFASNAGVANARAHSAGTRVKHGVALPTFLTQEPRAIST